MPSREDAEKATDKARVDALRAALAGDADKARELNELANVSRYVLNGEHEQPEQGQS